jgi:hypothetical protein
VLDGSDDGIEVGTEVGSAVGEPEGHEVGLHEVVGLLLGIFVLRVELR